MTMQNALDVQVSRLASVTPEARRADHDVPFQVLNCPSYVIAMQNRDPRHSISTRSNDVKSRVGEDHVVPFQRRTSPYWKVKHAVVDAHSTGQ